MTRAIAAAGRNSRNAMGNNIINTYEAPISVKGIVFEGGEVWLRKNERGEWELPGGKLDKGEQPSQTVVREMREELGFETEVVKIVHAHMHSISKSIDESGGVIVLSYLCKLLKRVGDFEIEGEAGLAEFKKFQVKNINELNMPTFYKEAVNMAWDER